MALNPPINMTKPKEPELNCFKENGNLKALEAGEIFKRLVNPGSNLLTYTNPLKIQMP